VEHGVDGIIAVDVLAEGFVGSPTDVRDSILRAVTFVAANQTTRALELLRGRVPVALLRLRSSATLSIDDFSRTQELIVRHPRGVLEGCTGGARVKPDQGSGRNRQRRGTPVDGAVQCADGLGRTPLRRGHSSKPLPREPRRVEGGRLMSAVPRPYTGLRPFLDRHDAGRRLAAVLGKYRGRVDLLVLGIPRGGVPVAFEVAQRLGAPLDVIVVRKLGVPFQPELAMGAIASRGVRVLNETVVREIGIPSRLIDQVAAREMKELKRREVVYRGERSPLDTAGRSILLVDDGLATGSSMRAAILALRQLEAKEVIVVVPVGPRETCAEMAALADGFVCLLQPAVFSGVGEWYDDFGPTSDDEVRELLERSRPRPANG